MERDEQHAALLGFLRRMGYRQTEAVFKEEYCSKTSEKMAFEIQFDGSGSTSNYFIPPNEGDTIELPQNIVGGFDKLKLWIHESLDIFRPELLQILYPIYVHTFLDLICKNLSHEGIFGFRIQNL